MEEIDAIFEGAKHSDVPDIEKIRKGQASIDVKAVENELESPAVGVVESAKVG